MFTGSTNCKNGSISQLIKWIYQILADGSGFVSEYREERLSDDFDFRIIKYYIIKSPFGDELSVKFVDGVGFIDGQFTRNHNYYVSDIIL